MRTNADPTKYYIIVIIKLLMQQVEPESTNTKIEPVNCNWAVTK